jgi:hypothetical protein
MVYLLRVMIDRLVLILVSKKQNNSDVLRQHHANAMLRILLLCCIIGSEWLKMALVEPAGLVNMIDVVLDEQSQRRTPSLLAFDGNGNDDSQRLIGAAAESLWRR